eukprot:12915781-Alexandrium_andersonii.AAC.1
MESGNTKQDGTWAMKQTMRRSCKRKRSWDMKRTQMQSWEMKLRSGRSRRASCASPWKVQGPAVREVQGRELHE